MTMEPQNPSSTDPVDDSQPPLPLGSPAEQRVRVATSPFRVIAVAASLGGIDALSCLLAGLPATFPVPIVVVQHISPHFPSRLPELLNRHTALEVVWARHGHLLRPGMVYVAPPDHHVVVGQFTSLRLSTAAHVQFVRPSADVLFSSVAEVYGERAIATVLTGMQSDGANGVRAVKRRGGRVLAQDAATSRAFGMPGAAIATGCVDFALPISAIAPALIALTMVPGAAAFLRVAGARLAGNEQPVYA